MNANKMEGKGEIVANNGGGLNETGAGTFIAKLVLHQTNGSQHLARAGDQFLDTYLFGIGTKGKAHQLGEIKDGNSIAGFIGLLNLPLTAIEVRLAKRTGDSNGISPCLLCLTENII